MGEREEPSTGIQELIDSIRDQGVNAAQSEADQLLREARQRASEIVSKAKSEADETRSQAFAEIEAHRQASLDALQLAARDTILELKARVTKRFEEFVERLVVSATHDKALIRNIVLVLAGRAVEEVIQDKDMVVRVSKALDGENTLEEDGNRTVLALTSDMLREGIEIVPDSEVEGGVRVHLVEDNLEIDLTDRAVSRLIAERLIPRFHSIMPDED
ncbi:V-type ATP synthase subunit E [Thalassoglobus neptunius]|uniref:V-type ATP synthase subunit E n=1 Tax=Thalassoglobus neptunius TaxID=1938619 RepID=A0A5C5X799_9PLAN|nr:hypothetical protein [Thalassoglobus neptunius]TWT58221.1 V-type ATP synthase subunit E [Thalassoglobus neptunius]